MRVAIVGFGIGGGALAVALSNDGHAVTVFEQAPSPGPVGAGFLLQPSGQAALASLGLLEGVAATSWPIRSFHAESAARIVLIGDAGHPSPPHLGQGANLALLDAIALAGALRPEPEPAVAFARWDRQRRWQNARYTYLSRALSPFFQSSHGWLGPARDLALPAMGAVRPLRAFMEYVLAGRG